MSKRTRLAGWRKIATANWRSPADPQIYGDIELDATKLLAFLERVRGQGHPVTVTHVVGRAIAVALGEHPDLNVRLYRGHLHQRETVDIFFIVSAEHGRELSGVKVERADGKSVVEVADELKARSSRIRTGDDVEYGKTKDLLGSTPFRLLRPSMRLAAWLTADLDLDLKRFGLPRQAFGSAMVTSVGMFGIQHAYAPLSPFYRIPLLVLVGEITKKAIVVDDEVVARPVLSLAATMDHRYLDGYHAARLARSARAYLEDPAAFEPGL